MILEKYCIWVKHSYRRSHWHFLQKNKFTDQQTEALSTLFHIYINIQFDLPSKTLVRFKKKKKAKHEKCIFFLCAMNDHNMSLKKSPLWWQYPRNIKIKKWKVSQIKYCVQIHCSLVLWSIAWINAFILHCA